MSTVAGENPAGPVRSAGLAIGGMTCASCAARAQKKLNKLDGVTATVNFATAGRESRGYDAGKKINGSKRFIVTDTLGLLLTVGVRSAGMQDRDGAKPVLLDT